LELRAALAESEVAELEGFDGELIDEIVIAVTGWSEFARGEGTWESEPTNDPEFDAGWAETQSALDQNRQAKRILNAIRDLEGALGDCSPAQRGALASIYRSLTQESVSGSRPPSAPECLRLLQGDIQRLSLAAERTKARGHRPTTPKTQIVREVGYAIRQFGGRQEPQVMAYDENGGVEDYPPLQRNEHLAQTIREVLDVVGISVKWSNESLLRYARLGPKWLIDRSG